MSGLPIGRLIDASRPSRWQAVRDLFRRAVPDADAVARFVGAFTAVKPPAPAVRLTTSVHTLTVAPPGAGKSTGLVVPFLRECPDSGVVLDVKGELYRLTHASRLAMGHALHVLDPWQVVTRQPATLNPFDWEDPSDPAALDFARDLAESVVVRTARDEPHWPDMAELFIGGAAAAVLTFAAEGRCHLGTVCNILADRGQLDQTVQALQESPAWDGILARIGHQMSRAGSEEIESVLSTSNRMLRFMSSPAVASSLAASTFDPADVWKRRCTVYLMIPAQHLRPNAGLLRLWLSTFHRAVLRRGVRE
ncbi:MAG: type IV secretory system conjugative DNA transfer family protein [Gemmataceae bacterium]